MGRRSSRLEHEILRTLRADFPAGRRWLLAVSGGVDSMVMAEVVWKWRRLLRLELAVGHVHHGSDSANSEYRDRALAHVRAWARERGLQAYTCAARPRGLKSEDDMRRFRHAKLESWRRRHNFDYVVLAHHRDDLLETRILRLLRGVGTQGLRSMSMTSGALCRPLLSVERSELEGYARDRGLHWVEDPSNHVPSSPSLRNWLRNEWLPQLESRQRGAKRALARSLGQLVPLSQPEGQLNSLVGLRRAALLELRRGQQERILARYLKSLGLQGYERTHVEEILKRLKTRQREFDFDLLGIRFRVTNDLVWASRV